MLCENALFMQEGIVSAQMISIDGANGQKRYKVHTKPSFGSVLEDLPHGTPALHLHKRQASQLYFEYSVCFIFSQEESTGERPLDRAGSVFSIP